MKTIPLTQGFHALVDDADYARLVQYQWRILHGKGPMYARRKGYVAGKQVTILMHRAIFNPPSHLQIDHIDGDGLNNQRHNLRLATASLNQRNHHRRTATRNGLPVGVVPSGNGYQAVLEKNNRPIRSGRFETVHEAELAYLAARAESIREAEQEIHHA